MKQTWYRLKLWNDYDIVKLKWWDRLNKEAINNTKVHSKIEDVDVKPFRHKTYEEVRYLGSKDKLPLDIRDDILICISDQEENRKSLKVTVLYLLQDTIISFMKAGQKRYK